MAAGLASRFNVFLGRARAFARDRRDRMAVLREVGALSGEQRAQLLEEAGMSYREFAVAMRTPFIAEDLNARALRAVGADPAAFRSGHVEWSGYMQRLCMTCTARSRCRRDLDTDVFGRQYRHYCSNAESLGEIAANGVHRAPIARPIANA